MDISSGLNKMENTIDQHPRRIARESVMQALYAQELNNDSPEVILDLYAKSYKSPDDTDYMRLVWPWFSWVYRLWQRKFQRFLPVCKISPSWRTLPG